MNRIRIRPFPSLQNRHKGPNSEHPTSEMKTVVKHFHRSKFSLLENSPPPPQPGRQTARASSRLATAHLIIPVDAPTSRHTEGWEGQARIPGRPIRWNSSPHSRTVIAELRRSESWLSTVEKTRRGCPDRSKSKSSGRVPCTGCRCLYRIVFCSAAHWISGCVWRNREPWP